MLGKITHLQLSKTFSLDAGISCNGLGKTGTQNWRSIAF